MIWFCNGLPGAMCQPVVHCPVQVEGQLCDLPRGNHRADRYEIAVSRREARAQPQITKEYVCCELDKPRRHRTEVLRNCGLTLRFGCLVDWKKVTGGRQKLRRIDSASFKDDVRHLHGRRRICLAGIERQMRDDFRNLTGFESAIELQI